MGAFKRLGDRVLGAARRGLDRRLPARDGAGSNDPGMPDAETDADAETDELAEAKAEAETGNETGTDGEGEADAGSTPSVSRVESTKMMIDRALGGERRDRQLTAGLISVMVALLVLIPLGSVALALIGLGPFPDGWAGAERIEVTTAADGRPGSLRDAIEQAAASGSDAVIALQANTTYRLTTGCERTDRPVDSTRGGVLELGKNGGVYIQGNGATVRQECAGQRVLHATGDDRLHFSEVTLSGGDAKSALGNGSGGALLSEGGGTVTIEDSMLTSNRAEDSGGAVALTGPGSTLKLERSVISGNTAGSAGGGVWVIGNLDAVNATITDNLADTNGGAVATAISLTFSTVVDNSSVTARSGRQLGAGQLTSFASYVAGGSGALASCSVERPTSKGYNVGDDSSCGFGLGLGDVANGPRNAVGLLDYYSRALPARPPVPGSVLVDRVPARACLAKTDIDGQKRSRPADLTRTDTDTTADADTEVDMGASCDVGAVELPRGLDVPLTAIAGPVATPVPAEARYTG